MIQQIGKINKITPKLSREIDAKSQQNIAAKAVQRKCCTAVLTNQNAVLRPKLTKSLPIYMITVEDATEKLRITMSSNRDF
jgi:hypothetical protein